ncbi:LAQU0S01e00320g1_1 [Lachancea quebecensis]|uniref:LAQU0S01e00320g1_1 n=1 Tax=Lachancea quebecensis TaxID=1654605 RepID=A0A0P1KM80_9SACH|nr:LAQU0S01e00320g1_1 [Lachancea quebecensis]
MKLSALIPVFCASVASGMCIVRFDEDFPLPVDTTQPVGDFMCNHEELWLHKFDNGTLALESVLDNSIAQIIPADSVFAETADDLGFVQTSDDNELMWTAA